MSDEILVELWQCPGVFIIVEKATGIIYTNQCGGTACSQPRAEGFLVPMDMYVGDKEGIADLTLDQWPTLHHMNKIEELERLVATFSNISNDFEWSPLLDADRLLDDKTRCGEAWVPVMTPYGPGWLTWENSD